MELNSDFKELFELFIGKSVKFVIVGGYALAFHGVPRYTGDIDILIAPTAENAARVVLALEEFGFSSVGLSAEDFTAEDAIVQLGHPPFRVDILTSVDGLTWDEISAECEMGIMGGLPLPVISKDHLIANKRAVGRTQDLADIEALGG